MFTKEKGMIKFVMFFGEGGVEEKDQTKKNKIRNIPLKLPDS